MAQYRITFFATEYSDNLSNHAMRGKTLSASYRVTAACEGTAVVEMRKKYDMQHEGQQWFQLIHTVEKLRD